MSRRRTPGHRDGLFEWTPGGDTVATEIADNPRARPCPACHAPAGHPCHTRTSRHTPMADYHPTRKSPQETDR